MASALKAAPANESLEDRVSRLLVGADLIEFFAGLMRLRFGSRVGLLGFLGFFHRRRGGCLGGLDFFISALLGQGHLVGFTLSRGGEFFFGSGLQLHHLLVYLLVFGPHTLGFSLRLGHFVFSFAGRAAGGLGQVLGGAAPALLRRTVGVGPGDLLVG